MIYFARRTEDSPIKIGQTQNVRARMKNLQMYLVGTRPGGFTEEKAIHRKFAYLRFTGTELFRPDQELLDFIAESAGMSNPRRVFRTVAGRNRERLQVLVSDDYKKWIEGLSAASRFRIPDLVRQALFHYATAIGYRSPPSRV
jgi:hypothetical protein